MEIEFRVAEGSDIEMLVLLVREFYEYDHHPFDERVVRTGLAEFLSDENLGQLWVIQASNEVVGYMALMFGYRLAHGYDAFLDEIYVRSNYRSRGIGRRALAFAEETCHRLGIKAIHLEIERENIQARALYTTVGYVDYDHYLMTCWIGEDQAQSSFAGENLEDSSLCYASFRMTGETPIAFKPAQNSEVETLIDFVRGTAGENNQATLARLVTDASLGRIWLIEVDGEPIGYVAITFSYSFEFHGHDAILDELYLRDSYWQEFSVPSLKFVQAQCSALGVNALHVEMERDNPPAQTIYQAAGFEDDDSYLMTKWLEQ